jgi:hypothetical protein
VHSLVNCLDLDRPAIHHTGHHPVLNVDRSTTDCKRLMRRDLDYKHSLTGTGKRHGLPGSVLDTDCPTRPFVLSELDAQFPKSTSANANSALRANRWCRLQFSAFITRERKGNDCKAHRRHPLRPSGSHVCFGYRGPRNLELRS